MRGKCKGNRSKWGRQECGGEGLNTEEVSFELGLEEAWERVSGKGASASRSQESAGVLGDKEQVLEAEALVRVCAESNLFVYLLKRKQSPIWTMAFFINQNQSLLMHEGPAMLHRALFSAF